MKVNASTSTTFEIEDYKTQKKISLQQLFMPQFRYQLLLEKVFSYYNESCVNKENQIDFTNKSIFIYNYKKRKNLNANKRKPNSVKNLFSDKLELKSLNSHNLSQKNLSINETINNSNIKNISNYNSKNINNNSEMKNIKNNRYQKLLLKNVNNTRNKNMSHNTYFSQTSAKKNLRFYPFKKRINLSDVKVKLNFGNEKKINHGKEKLKFKLINIFNNNKNHNTFLSNKKENLYKLRIKKA